MAMAVDGTLEHASINVETQAPENCWSTTAWEEHHQAATDSGSMEGSGRGGGDYSTGRMEWDLKPNPWEWENIAMVYPPNGGGRQGDGGGGGSHNTRIQVSSSEWGHVVCGSTTMVSATSSPAALKNSDFSIGLPSGSSTPPSGVSSVSSGIPGLAASRGNNTSHNELSSLVKSEPDEPIASRTSENNASEQQRRLFLGLGGVQAGDLDNGGVSENGGGKETMLLDGSGSSTPSAKGGDAFIGLKLGRQTYFEDSAAAAAAVIVGQKVATTAAPVFSPPGKRQRAMSPGMQTPRCQVEGCKTDLTPAKDYHRRHKVCEMHSKASRCIAGGQEQRFCQQCSRFHVLTEFDEGKRSCRRRLAGHNERRRKPHTQSHTALSIKASSPLHSDSNTHPSGFTAKDNKRSIFLQHPRRPASPSASLGDDEYASPFASSLKLSPWPRVGQQDDNRLACQLQASGVDRQSILSTLLCPTADRLLMLLQSPKGQMAASSPCTTEMAIGSCQFMEGALSSLGQGLSLSSSSGGVLGGLEQTHMAAGSQGLSSISARDSGRALSLLSSQSRVSRPPLHLPAQDLPQVNTTLEQFVAGSSEGNNHSTSFSPQLQLLPTGRTTTPQQQQRYAGVEKLLSCTHTSSGNRSMDKNVENSGDRHCNNSSDNFISALDSYDRSHSMLTLFQTGQQFGGFSSGTAANTRPTIDLMQTPTAQVQTLQNGSNGGGQSQSLPSSNGYSEYSPMRHFEASMFSSQQML